jgi:iron complex outermembrane receptor protein
MRGAVVEIGTRGGHGIGAASNWAWDLSIYYAEIDEEILSIDDPAAPGTSLVTNIDATTHAGIEASVNFSLALGDSGTHFLEPLASLAVNEFNFDNDAAYGNNTLPAAPGYVLRGELIYRNQNGFHLGPTIEFVGDRYADFANNYKVGSYSLLGMRGGWTDGRWSVFADAVNVGDRNYIASHSVRNFASANDAILNPGLPASVYVGIRRRFE